jgi:hypothetical protein
MGLWSGKTVVFLSFKYIRNVNKKKDVSEFLFYTSLFVAFHFKCQITMNTRKASIEINTHHFASNDSSNTTILESLLVSKVLNTESMASFLSQHLSGKQVVSSLVSTRLNNFKNEHGY